MKIDRGSENREMAGEGVFRRFEAFPTIFLTCALAYVKIILYLCMRFGISILSSSKTKKNSPQTG